MKTLKKIGLGLLAILALFIIIGFFLPGKSLVTRSIVINASPETVFPLVNNLKNWEQWSPWQAMDPTVKLTYGEIVEGVGATYTWDGPETGKGKVTITASEPNKQMLNDVEFDGMGVSKAAYLLENENGATKLSWTFESENGMNPFTRWISVLIKGMLEDQFDQGLNKIKELAEKAPKAAEQNWKGRVEEAKVEQLTEKFYLAYHDTASVSTVSEKLGMAYGEIGKAIGAQKLEEIGAPFAIYYSESNTMFEFDAALPVSKAGKDAGKVKAGKIAAGNAVVVSFYGDYSQTPLAHETADNFIVKEKKQIIGAPWEEYVTDPQAEKDTAKWLTKVYYPIK